MVAVDISRGASRGDVAWSQEKEEGGGDDDSESVQADHCLS